MDNSTLLANGFPQTTDVTKSTSKTAARSAYTQRRMAGDSSPSMSQHMVETAISRTTQFQNIDIATLRQYGAGTASKDPSGYWSCWKLGTRRLRVDDYRSHRDFLNRNKNEEHGLPLQANCRSLAPHSHFDSMNDACHEEKRCRNQTSDGCWARVANACSKALDSKDTLENCHQANAAGGRDGR
jgi:hypothetical protein